MPLIFRRYLLELLEEELCQPASNLYPHNLAGILETAIRATNTQYEDPEILDRLDVRLLEITPGDTGWDVFSLDYKVAGPIGTVSQLLVLTERTEPRRPLTSLSIKLLSSNVK